MDMERAAREEEIVYKKDAEASAGGALTLKKRRKRKRPGVTVGASSGTSVGVGTILSRLHARTAIACTALSKRHRSLIRSPEFGAPSGGTRGGLYKIESPAGAPDIAYLAAALIKRRPEHEHPTSGYYGFRTAGARIIGDALAPMGSLAGYRFLGTEYVNTCKGVLLLASKGFSDLCRCTLWNPAMGDVGSEAPVPKPPSSEKKTSVSVVLSDDEDDKDSSIQTVLWYDKTQFLALGLGYGRRNDTYKLLLCRKDISQISRSRPSASGKQRCRLSGGTTRHFEYSLVVQTLGWRSGASDMPLRTVLPMETVLSYKEEVDQEIMERKSLYMDGTIYFLYRKKNVMLAFDVDDETVRTIDMPGKGQKDNVQLIKMYGRPCLAIINAKDSIALWLLTEDYQLEPIHVISYKSNLYYGCRSIVGVWDCGGVLVLCFECSEKGELLLYDVAAKKIFRANLPGDFVMKKSEYMLCWGYNRTLVSPESIVGKQWRGRWAHITEVIKPLVQQDKRKGQKATLSTVCLMEFLVRIMQKLPHDLQYVVEMPSMDSEEPDLPFQNVV